MTCAKAHDMSATEVPCVSNISLLTPVSLVQRGRLLTGTLGSGSILVASPIQVKHLAAKKDSQRKLNARILLCSSLSIFAEQNSWQAGRPSEKAQKISEMSRNK